MKLPFPLAADPDKKAVRAYDVDGGGYAERVTFVIAGGKIEKVIEGRDALDPAGSLAACPAHPKSPTGKSPTTL